MLILKGKLKRLDGGMPQLDFHEWAQANSERNGVGYRPQALRAFCACAHRVRAEHASEIAATIQMLCDSTAITNGAYWPILRCLAALDLKGLRVYTYDSYTLAIETDMCWLIYPLNIRHVNWQLSHRRQA